MTIEELAEQATDGEGFSHDGEVFVQLDDGEVAPVASAQWYPELKHLVLVLVTRPNVP